MPDLPIVHHPDYEAADFPPSHRFPMAKFRHLPEVLMLEGLAAPGTFLLPEPAPREALCRVHDVTYVDAVRAGAVPKPVERAIGLPMTPSVGLRGATATGGTMLAAQLAMERGIACNTAGGSHHAGRAHGAGFCVFNDVAVAAADLLARHIAGHILIFDCDVHQGDGTADIFRDEPRVVTVSMHGANNYPAQKQASVLDVPLPDAMGDDSYMRVLQETLRAADQLGPYDIVFYNAGVDPHVEDVLGRLSLTDNGLALRDHLVIDHFRTRNVPVCGVIGGGYMKDHLAVASRHAILHRVAARYLQKA
ncbi:MAG: histone deacetylase [Pseudomonadota bacterium]